MDHHLPCSCRSVLGAWTQLGAGTGFDWDYCTIPGSVALSYRFD
jgi:hypothetical protein